MTRKNFSLVGAVLLLSLFLVVGQRTVDAARFVWSGIEWVASGVWLPDWAAAGTPVSAPHEDVQKAAVYALVEAGHPEARRALVEMALDPYEVDLARTAVYALADVRDSQSLLEQVLVGSPHAEVRKAAVYALGDASGPDAVPTLIMALNEDASVAVRKAAVHTLAEIDTPEARSALIALINRHGPASP